MIETTQDWQPDVCQTLCDPFLWKRCGPLWVACVSYTPEMAGAILEHRNDKNRELLPMQVSLLAESIRRGEWQLTGETIIFDRKGTLRNGQNRLKACVLARLPITVLTVAGVEDSVFDVLDQGTRRTMRQVLHIMGKPDPRQLACLTSTIPHFQATGEIVSTASGRASIRSLLRSLDRYPFLGESAAFGRRWTRHARVMHGQGLISALHWILSRVHTGQERQSPSGGVVPFADDFLGSVLDDRSDQIDFSRPNWSLVQRLREGLRNKNLLARTKGRVEAEITAAMTVFTWNAVCENAAPKKPSPWAHWKSGQPFPRVWGWDYDAAGPVGSNGGFHFDQEASDEADDQEG